MNLPCVRRLAPDRAVSWVRWSSEAGLLSLLGCALGLLLAYWIIAAVHSLPAGTIPAR